MTASFPISYPIPEPLYPGIQRPELKLTILLHLRGPFEKFVDWRQCAAVMQKEAVTVMPSCSGGDNVIVV